jgi:hypothetical protein
VIVLRGVNQNTRQIGVVTQRLENPQQPAHSVGTDESRLPSTFHSAASNDHHVPIAPGFADRYQAEENLDRQFAEENPAEANPEARLADQQEEPGSFITSKQSFMKCKFLLLLNMYIAIFTWKNCSLYGTVVTVFLGLDRHIHSNVPLGTPQPLGSLFIVICVVRFLLLLSLSTILLNFH